MWLLIATIGILCYYLYKNLHSTTQFWKERGISYVKPLLFFGNFMDLALKRDNVYNVTKKLYNKFPEKRYVGIQQFNTPMLMIRDLDLIKQITVKDFDHFVDRRIEIDDELDPMFGKNLLVLKGQKWKDMRGILSPTFTSSKMKAMFSFMADCSKNLTDYFLNKNEQVTEVEMKELFSRFTNDVIASTAFGYNCDSIENPNNKFFQMGNEITNARGINGLRLLLINFYPSIMKTFRLQVFPKPAKFFNHLVSHSIKEREEKKIVRLDLIHLMMEMRKGNLKYEESSEQNDTGFATVQESEIGKQQKQQGNTLTDQDIAAQAMLFFFAGFETASTTLSFLAYELAVNEDVQDKLIEEIDETAQACKGSLTYDAVLKMKYLDMVISETLRKWSAPFLDRRCVKDFLIEPKEKGEKPFLLEKGMCVFIPVYGFHTDPKYFPEPQKFDPERFSDENKHNIVPYSYMPFGAGPRNCIGSRFALLESKVMVFHFLSKFRFVVTPRTQVPLKLTNNLRLASERGIYLGIKKR